MQEEGGTGDAGTEPLGGWEGMEWGHAWRLWPRVGAQLVRFVSNRWESKSVGTETGR